MRHFSDRVYLAGYVSVYIPRSALVLLGLGGISCLSRVRVRTPSPQVVMSQLAYERDDPPFVFGITSFLLLFIFHPAFYLL
jgi:hypothetical protein